MLYVNKACQMKCFTNLYLYGTFHMHLYISDKARWHLFGKETKKTFKIGQSHPFTTRRTSW